MKKENDDDDDDGADDKDISVRESTNPERMEKVGEGCNDNKENSTESKTFLQIYPLWGTKRLHTLFMTNSNQKGVRRIQIILCFLLPSSQLHS